MSKDSPKLGVDSSADLMGNSENEQIFVAEVDDDGFSVLRFGSDGLGLQPTAGTQFYATYRVGGGIAGNVGADSIVRVVFRQGLHSIIRSVRNPLPATVDAMLNRWQA